MSDLFHESIDERNIDKVFAVMAIAKHHIFQVLTKRPDRMAEYCNNFTIEQLRRGADAAGLSLPPQFGKGFCYLPNVHLGVTVENQKAADQRIPLLKRTPAALRFLSCEPLLEPIRIGNLTGIDWVIVGGESGPRSRDCDIRWVESIVSQCRSQGVAVWVKQLGDRCLGLGHGYKGKGTDPEEWPESIRFQQHAKPSGLPQC
jgi:protein gp37